jgi:hypothetical protein
MTDRETSDWLTEAQALAKAVQGHVSTALAAYERAKDTSPDILEELLWLNQKAGRLADMMEARRLRPRD